ncbi:hypothetical protein PMAYCL1PPCAC_29143, partial [Pristionchus mayeri]
RMRAGTFTPLEGYVIKFKKVNEEPNPDLPPSYVKAFINVLHSPQIPDPNRELSIDEATEIIKSDAAMNTFEVPLALSKMIDVVTDKSGENAMKFDVMVSSNFYNKFLTDQSVYAYRNVFISKACAAIKEVHHAVINYWEAILLNRKMMGKKPTEQDLILFKSSKSLVKEIEKTTSVESKPMVMVAESTDDSVGDNESIVGDSLSEYPDIYSAEQNDRVRLRIIEGEKLEIRIMVDSFEGLRLSMSRDHVLLRNRHQSLADFHLCVPIQKKKVSTKIYKEKKMVEILAPVAIPRDD